jgi:hypothetical protein
MLLTLLAAEQPGLALLWLVRLDLWTVAATALGLLWALLAVEPRQLRWTHRLALVGSILFYLQTVILDAIVWVSFFKI